MKSSKAVVFTSADKPLETKHISLPNLKQEEVLVKVSHCSLCASDLHSFNGKRKVPAPTILGHEILGNIVAFGPGLKPRTVDGLPLKIGDRITWSIINHCGHCSYCQRGIPQKCDNLFKYGHQIINDSHQLHGGLAEYCHLKKDTSIFLAPENVPGTVLCPSNCATATVMAAVRSGEGCQDKNIFIQGCGALGLTACAVAKMQGAKKIIATDKCEQRLDLATKFGADVCLLATSDSKEFRYKNIQDCTNNKGVDLVLEFSGAQESINEGIQSLGIGGKCILVGAVFPGPKLNISAEVIIKKMITITGIHNYVPKDLSEALCFLEKNHDKFPFELLTSKTFPLSSANSAFHYATEKKPLRVIISY